MQISIDYHLKLCYYTKKQLNDVERSGFTTNGGKIKSFREKNDLTQRYIAYKMGVSQQAVVKWEHGTANPRLELIPKLAMLLNCSIDELVLGDDSEDCCKRA